MMSFNEAHKTILTCLLAILFGCSINKEHNHFRDAPVFYKNLYNLTSHDKFRGTDSAIINYFPNGKISSSGKFAKTKTGDLSNLKVGKWAEYYQNGMVKSQGEYKIGRFIDCGTGGLEQAYYNYKVGYWSYHSPDGSIKAMGKYHITRCKVRTRCGEDTLNFGLTTKQWNFYGNKTSQNLRDYESVTNSDEYFIDILYFDRDKNYMGDDSQPIKK